MIQGWANRLCVELRVLIEAERVVAVGGHRLAGEERRRGLNVGVVTLPACHVRGPLVHRADATRHQQLVDIRHQVLERRRLQIFSAKPPVRLLGEEARRDAAVMSEHHDEPPRNGRGLCLHGTIHHGTQERSSDARPSQAPQEHSSRPMCRHAPLLRQTNLYAQPASPRILRRARWLFRPTTATRAKRKRVPGCALAQVVPCRCFARVRRKPPTSCIQQSRGSEPHAFNARSTRQVSHPRDVDWMRNSTPRARRFDPHKQHAAVSCRAGRSQRRPRALPTTIIVPLVGVSNGTATSRAATGHLRGEPSLMGSCGRSPRRDLRAVFSIRDCVAAVRESRSQ